MKIANITINTNYYEDKKEIEIIVEEVSYDQNDEMVLSSLRPLKIVDSRIKAEKYANRILRNLKKKGYQADIDRFTHY